MPPRRPRRATAADPPDAAAAMEIGLRFLGTRPRTRHELEQRLERAAVPADLVETTIDRLSQLGYVDDAAFARWWSEQRDRHAPRGRRMLEAELRQRGVPRDVIQADRVEHVTPERAPEDEGFPGTEPERARAALDRHLHGRRMPTDPKAVRRIGMFLMRRGFDAETVRATIRAARPPGDEGDDDDPGA